MFREILAAVSTMPIPPLTKLLLGCIPVVSILHVTGLSQFAVPHYLAFIPANTVFSHFFVWSVVTNVLLEWDVVSLVISLASIWFIIQRAEKDVGTERLALFVMLVMTCTCAMTIVVGALAYGVVGWLWLYESFMGFAPAATAGAMIVAHTTGGCQYAFSTATSASAAGTSSLPAANELMRIVRTRHLPFSLVLIALVHDVWKRVLFPLDSQDLITEMDIGSTEVFEGPTSLVTTIAFVVSWFVIRWWGLKWLHIWRRESTSDDGGDADASPQFALHELIFPLPLRLASLAVTTAVFPLLRAVGIGKHIDTAAAAAKNADQNNFQQRSHAERFALLSVANPVFSQSIDGAGSGGSTVALSALPGSSTADADRRRAMALAALTARLQQLQSKPSGQTQKNESRDAADEDIDNITVVVTDEVTVQGGNQEEKSSSATDQSR